MRQNMKTANETIAHIKNIINDCLNKGFGMCERKYGGKSPEDGKWPTFWNRKDGEHPPSS